jgi:hypothetical protein
VNLKATFDHARKRAQTSNISEIVYIQSEFVRTQYAAMQEQLKQLGASVLPENKN